MNDNIVTSLSSAELAVSDCQVNNWNEDVESLDEGLGDVSSECEQSWSKFSS